VFALAIVAISNRVVAPNCALASAATAKAVVKQQPSLLTNLLDHRNGV